MTTQTFRPIWVSSVQHLEAFARVLDRWPRWKMALGFSAPMPADFPQVRSFSGFRFTRAPLVMFASGVLRLDGGTALFESEMPPARLGVTWFNLNRDLEFELSGPALDSIDRYKQPRAAFRYYLFDWVRVGTRRSLLGGNFLLAVGNYGVRMKNVRKGSDELYQTLSALRGRSVVG